MIIQIGFDASTVNVAHSAEVSTALHVFLFCALFHSLLFFSPESTPVGIVIVGSNYLVCYCSKDTQ